MPSPEPNYQALSESHVFHNEGEDVDSPNEHEETPGSSGIMIHTVPETNKARWNHIEDLDSFFTRMYNYHQKHGFTVIVLQEIFQLFEFGFVVWLLTYTVHCINYPVLFGNIPPEQPITDNRTKVTLSDVIIPMGKCVENFSGITYFILFLATLYFMVRFIKAIYLITQYSDIKKFYNSALHVEDHELDNITWHEVKRKIREVQAEQHMCIDKEQLTELDIYHRILRFKNYMVALMNKNLLPVKMQLPLIGNVVTLSRGLLFNIDFILFRGPGSPFQNNWQLRDDYAVRSNQVELAHRLSKLIMWVAIVNLLLFPIIFFWQLIYFSFAYANILRKEPGALGMRTWSNYGRLYLRHFNELEHELDGRLNRAYEYADRYLSSFSSPIMAVIAKNGLFISGGLLVLILTLGIYDEYVFQVEHVLTIITVLSVIGLVCRTMIPNENMIWCPEQLMTAIQAHVHYLPSGWKNRAHTADVRNEFGNFFQFRAGYILNEIFSPITTPLILMFQFRPKALEIVKFFRTFTVTVRGVGNVCSFAQMDVRKHGNPDWQLPKKFSTAAADEQKHENAVENGKTELSLIRFTLTNPEWQMPPDAVNFLKEIRENAVKDLKRVTTTTNRNVVIPSAITESLVSFGTIDDEYSSIATSVLNTHNVPNAGLYTSMMKQSYRPTNKVAHSQHIAQGSGFEQMLQQNLSDQAQAQTGSQYMSTSLGPTEGMRKMHVSKVEGRLEGPSEALLYSLYGIDTKVDNPVDITVADMCLSTLYMHELHRQNLMTKSKEPPLDAAPGPSTQKLTVIVSKATEDTPLLGSIRS